MDSSEINYVQDYLRNYSSRKDNEDEWQQYYTRLKKLKQYFVEEDNQAQARLIWCFEQILKIQNYYLKAYLKLKERLFYEAWCDLERAELEISFLNPHHEFNNEFGLEFIKTKVKQYQLLYPYKYFLSPEVLEKKKKCNICNKEISLRNPCRHVVGEIYDGEMCCRIVTEGELLGVAVVEEPLQKYSVLFMSDQETGKDVDRYDYSNLDYLISALKNPYHDWVYTVESVLYPHSRFNNFGRNDKCPCGSGKKYKRCCLLNDGVLGNHYQFNFEIEPPEDIPRYKMDSC